MELDAFTEALGTRQGRLLIQSEPRTYALVLGDLVARRRQELTRGDFVEWGQEVDLTDEVLVGARGSLRVPSDMPPELGWEVSITVDGQKRACLLALPGRSQRLDDLAAFVGAETGRHVVAIRLELVSTDG